jgi:assimilatory nitrate reductase catalytic subunit
VLKAELPWRLTAMAWFSDDELPVKRRQLQALLARFDYAALVPFGHQRNGLLLRAAAAELPAAELVLEIEALFALDASQASVLRYEDKKRGQRRVLRLVTVEGERRLDAFLLAGDESAQGWMRSMLQSEQATPSQAHRLLAAGSKAPSDAAPASPQVCNCFNVNADQINTLLSRCTGSADERLMQLQGELKCGTQCGSCLPSLRERVRLSLACGLTTVTGSRFPHWHTMPTACNPPYFVIPTQWESRRCHQSHSPPRLLDRWSAWTPSPAVRGGEG